jgi:serine/threonine protein kinase/tetratricopeptide (TPR) repeat protein
MHDRPENWERLKDIVADVLDAPTADRAALLAELCSDDTALLTAARELIDAYDDSTGVIDHRTDAWLGIGGPDVLSLGGQRIGRYVLDRLIGEGGMAAVYRARQVATDRVVAIKLFRVALPLIDAHNRFRREAQALARLQHKNIASIFEAALHETADQRALPYIAMEYVDGKPLVEYARHHRLDRTQRIELLITVARAVQAAHQQAIIHRDLKPANILVDSHGEPKILDFGIARISTGESDRVTWQTTAGLLLGTPGYMAPEQCGSHADDIDVRADVWALGVLLYELLCDRLPIDVSNASITEVLRRITSEEPVLPRTINPSLRGDLETIMMTTLRRDRTLRYATAQALADDLQRFLTNRPIEARPPTTLYLLTKFAKRNKGTIATAMITALLILTTTIMAIVGFIKASQERDNAVAAQKLAVTEKQNAASERDRAVAAEAQATTDRDLALAASNRSESVSKFLLELLRSPDPNKDGREVTVLEQIRKVLPTIGERFENSPPAEAEVRAAIGKTLFELAEYDLARQQMDRAIEITTGVEGATSRDTLRMRTVLVEIVRWQDRPAEALEINQKLMADALSVLPKDDIDVLPIRGAQAGIEGDLEHFDQAIAQYRELIADHRRVNADHPERLLPVLSNLANVLMLVSQYDEATKVLEEAIAGYEKLDGPDAASVIIPRFNLGQCLNWAGRYDEALPILQDNLARSTRIYGPQHDHTLIVQRNLADLLRTLGRLDEAVAIFDDLVGKSTQAFGAQHRLTQMAKNSLALTLNAQGKRAEAIELLREIIADSTDATPLSNRTSSQRNLAEMLVADKKFEEALVIYDQVLEIERGVGEETYGYLITHMNRGELHLDAGRPVDAERDLRVAIEGFAKIQQPLEVAVAQRLLGSALTAQKRFDEAEATLNLARPLLDEHTMAKNMRRTAQAYFELYTAWNKPDAAAEWKAKLDTINASTQPVAPATVPATQP